MSFTKPVILIGALSCVGATAWAQPAPSSGVTRTDAELATVLQTACEQADGNRVLIEFSAPWCGDCRRVKALTHEEVLQQELKLWQVVSVDVGRFERHMALATAFELSALAFWVATAPVDCHTSANTWPVLRKTALEPASNPGELGDATSLARWLADARTAMPPSQDTPTQ